MCLRLRRSRLRRRCSPGRPACRVPGRSRAGVPGRPPVYQLLGFRQGAPSTTRPASLATAFSSKGVRLSERPSASRGRRPAAASPSVPWAPERPSRRGRRGRRGPSFMSVEGRMDVVAFEKLVAGGAGLLHGAWTFATSCRASPRRCAGPHCSRRASSRPRRSWGRGRWLSGS